jgi:hypothetical protein
MHAHAFQPAPAGCSDVTKRTQGVILIYLAAHFYPVQNRRVAATFEKTNAISENSEPGSRNGDTFIDWLSLR